MPERYRTRTIPDILFGKVKAGRRAATGPLPAMEILFRPI
jgi:hypothetical protein